jgi:carboxypeptidase Taq
MTTAWSHFEAAAREIRALESIDGLAGWDQETFMPANGAEARATQRAALKGVIHEKLTHDRFGELLERAAAVDGLDTRQLAMIRAVRRDREREIRLPLRLVTEIAEEQGRAVEAWKIARRESRFSLFLPHLKRLIALRCEEADARGHSGERYDPLLDGSEPGMTTARLRPIFARLRDGLVPLVEELTSRPPPRTDFLSRDVWDTDVQYAYSIDLIRGIGFNLEAGRLDRNDGANAIFSALHEAGHGLYEQGLPVDGSPLSNAPSMGIHESQSRLWENFIGRSRPFWSHWFPQLKARFPEPLADVSLDEWLGAINAVERSLIRVDADEVTYNLHVLARFELELAFIRGDLKAKDLPGAWNEKYEKFVGIRPPDDRQGVLQDIHWAGGDFGYFPTYSIGNMYAAALMQAAQRDLPKLWDDVAAGNPRALLDWLRAKVHTHGRAKDAEQIVIEATGEGLTEKHLLSYLRAKYAV